MSDPSLLQIVFYPDPILKKVAQPVDQISDLVPAVARRMLDLMRESGGVGLAAPQVGLSWRMFVANPTQEPGDDRVFINPVLSEPSRTTGEREEGCLSLPDVHGQIQRPEQITIEALDEHANKFRLTNDDLPARVWQHEFDHLEGVLIIDRMTQIDRISNRRTLRQLEKVASR